MVVDNCNYVPWPFNFQKRVLLVELHLGAALFRILGRLFGFSGKFVFAIIFIRRGIRLVPISHFCDRMCLLAR